MELLRSIPKTSKLAEFFNPPVASGGLGLPVAGMTGAGVENEDLVLEQLVQVSA